LRQVEVDSPLVALRVPGVKAWNANGGVAIGSSHFGFSSGFYAQERVMGGFRLQRAWQLVSILKMKTV